MHSAIPPHSTVLVTGINGFIASHVADQLLEAGYTVRGTVRTLRKGEFIRNLFADKYGEERIEIFEVPDISAEGAFDEAIKDVHGIAHVATINSKSPDPNAVIPGTIAALSSILESALKSTVIERFVYTSSSTACTLPKPNDEFAIDHSTWNEENIESAWLPPPWKPGHEWAVYAASKAQTEQSLWKFRDERHPRFGINAVLPDTNFGPMLDPSTQSGSSAGIVKRIWEGQIDKLKGIAPQWFVDVRDTARLHVAALTQPDVVNERIFGFVQPYNWNDVLAILRELRPEHDWPQDMEGLGRDLSRVATDREHQMLKNMGRPGWVSLRESLEAALAGIPKDSTKIKSRDLSYTSLE